jgi:ABC-2 type transport system ATP-binding protein
MDGEADIEGDIEESMDGEAISVLEAEGAMELPGSAVAPPPQAARVRGKAMAALRAAIRTKRVLDKMSSWRCTKLVLDRGFLSLGRGSARPRNWIGPGCRRSLLVSPRGGVQGGHRSAGTISSMAKRTTILKVSGLRRAFGPNTIFDKFNLEVRTGEAIALTGRNGAGKSTLLRCLIGADRPDDGTVEVCGNKMAETSPQIRRDVATVIDDLDFFPDLSVVEHLDLLARAHGIEDPDDVVDEVLEEVQLVPQSGQLPGTLSSGQRRRLALATAFVRPRKLLILDEPEQRLDTEGVRWLAERLKTERQQGLAIVFASHEPSLVETVATRIVELGAPRG